jgi:hypothetical protein
MNAPAEITAFSFGGGVQSVAALALQARGDIHFDHWLFANVGDDSEKPAPLRYITEHAAPYAERHGIDLQILHRTRRNGDPETLWQRLNKPGSRSIDIPVRMAGTAAPGNPLLDLRLRRTDCIGIIRDAGLPVPPKSACWFCPLHSPEDWADMRRSDPDLFARACDLEDQLIQRRGQLDKDPVYLTRYGAEHGRRLGQVIPAGRDLLPIFDGDADCDSGWCMT